ncbi:MAG TPA: acetate--CoA ligase family protein [Acidobacteriota bacterium]|nr:acetate--CoA ligase family protein [Acidobacteriota bacterium]
MHDLDAIFRPRSVAVIGASQHPGKIGYEIVHNIIKYGFQGKLFPVNPKAQFVHSVKCYPSIGDIPDDVDLAVIVVPREKVLASVDECGAKGVRGLIVITAGFKETSEEGLRQERQLAEKVRNYGMRMVGPNCMGVINTEPAVHLDATFAPELPRRGNIAFISQSGALGVTILSLSRERHLGFSMFASIGNKTNLSSNDLLEYWEDDPETQMVLLYLENFGNPRRFSQIAKRFTRKKPLLVVKSGRTLAGARAASSHTGALANLDVATDAIFDQYGVLRANTIDELFDYATALASQPLPQDNRIAIITNAGGPGIMATDVCVNLGLELAEYSSATVEALQKILPPEGNPNNPLDLLAGATPEQYRQALDILFQDPHVSAALVINVPPMMVDPVKVATAVSEVAARHGKPVLGCFMGVKDILRTIQETSQSVIPLYAFPESAARALHGMVRYAKLRRQEYGEPRVFDVDRAAADRIFARAFEEKRALLELDEIQALLRAYGIPSAEIRLARTMEEVVQQARKLGYPVVMKALLERTQHKSDIGGVAVDLRTDSEVIDAYNHISEGIRRHGLENEWRGVYLQPMVKGGKEVILGMTYDPTFGPMMMFGLGGVYVETMKDTVFRISPITESDARTMIQSVKAYPLLKGVRGEQGVDLDFLTEILQRLSQMASDFHFIKEMEINPFMASPRRESCLAVDARMLLDWNLAGR